MKTAVKTFLILGVFVFAGCRSAATETKTEAKAETKTETAQKRNETKRKEIAQVSVREAKKLLEESQDAQFIDVRTPEEYAGKHAAGAINFPLDKLETELSRLDKDKPVYVICETGRRSQMGSEILQKAGFKDVYNVKGGTSEWIGAGLPTEK